MANRCHAFQHGECSACGQYCNPDHTHAHIFVPGETTLDQICPTCYESIAGSSTVILQALNALGVKLRGRDIVTAAQNGRIQILIQGSFDFFAGDAPARN